MEEETDKMARTDIEGTSDWRSELMDLNKALFKKEKYEPVMPFPVVGGVYWPEDRS